MSRYPFFEKYKQKLTAQPFTSAGALPGTYQLHADKGTDYSTYYAPFEHQNPEPRIALVGITPGRQQAALAHHAARLALSRGLSDENCLKATKIAASFGGDMRNPLVEMLDLLGVHKHLEESTCANLWTPSGYPKAHFCSLLGFPTFKAGKDYNGTPSLKECDSFSFMLTATASVLDSLPRDTLVLPLGTQVLDALVELRKAKVLKRELLSLDGQPICVPHPSGQNAESVNLVLDWRYDSADEYAEARYHQYLIEKPWLKKGGKGPQTPSAYKSARKKRWGAVQRLRQYFL
jgi:hypothetical protein